MFDGKMSEKTMAPDVAQFDDFGAKSDAKPQKSGAKSGASQEFLGFFERFFQNPGS